VATIQCYPRGRGDATLSVIREVANSVRHWTGKRRLTRIETLFGERS
jgi:hypothetical protein